VFCVVYHLDEENAHPRVHQLENERFLPEGNKDCRCDDDMQQCKPNHAILGEERY